MGTMALVVLAALVLVVVLEGLTAGRRGGRVARATWRTRWFDGSWWDDSGSGSAPADSGSGWSGGDGGGGGGDGGGC